jgi:hypothetical protein
MTPRRSRYAPADESRIPHGLVTYDVYRRGLARKHPAIGTDLHAALRQAIFECEADGWAIENRPHSARQIYGGADGLILCRCQSQELRRRAPRRGDMLNDGEQLVVNADFGSSLILGCHSCPLSL